MNKELIISKLQSLKPYLKEKFGIKKMALFGSFAKDTQNENSDIDLVIEFDETQKIDFFETEKLREFLKKELGNKKVEIVNKKYINPIIEYYSKNSTIHV